MALILLIQKGGISLAKKKEDVWEATWRSSHMKAYMTVEEFLSFFEIGLRGHFARSNSMFSSGDTYHVEDMAYQAEFFAENFAMIISAIDWKDTVDGKQYKSDGYR
jgi:hypothetical protein